MNIKKPGLQTAGFFLEIRAATGISGQHFSGQGTG